MTVYTDLKHLKTNPFATEHSKPKVFIADGYGPYDNTINALKKLDLSSVAGKRVLLKPNAGRMATYDKGVTTHPQVVAAAIDVFKKNGADVYVGESPISGVNTLDAFKITGIKDIADKRGCHLIDMDERKFINVSIPNSMALKSMKVCPEIFEFDIIVSIPVMKTHMHTEATLAVKNMKGCLWRRSKVKLHMLPPVEGHKDKPIDIAISDMATILKPHLSIIDGTVCMQGLGPSAGNPCPMDIVIVSANVFAADTVAAELMDIGAKNVPHLRICAERGFGYTDLDQIDIIHENWKKLVKTFARPPVNLSLSYPNIKVYDNNSCSACQSSLYLFLKRYGKKLDNYCSEGEPLNLAIGKGNENLPDGTICIGNCVRNQEDVGEFITGCPPVASEILSAITGRHAYDTKDGHGDKE
jgi:uncharacterized protein (DUF362 family)